MEPTEWERVNPGVEFATNLGGSEETGGGKVSRLLLISRSTGQDPSEETGEAGGTSRS